MIKKKKFIFKWTKIGLDKRGSRNLSSQVVSFKDDDIDVLNSTRTFKRNPTKTRQIRIINRFKKFNHGN